MSSSAIGALVSAGPRSARSNDGSAADLIQVRRPPGLIRPGLLPALHHCRTRAPISPPNGRHRPIAGPTDRSGAGADRKLLGRRDGELLRIRQVVQEHDSCGRRNVIRRCAEFVQPCADSVEICNDRSPLREQRVAEKDPHARTTSLAIHLAKVITRVIPVALADLNITCNPYHPVVVRKRLPGPDGPMP